MFITCEQEARNLLEEMQIENVHSMSDGELAPLADFINSYRYNKRVIESVHGLGLAMESDPNNLSPHTPGAKLDANKPNCDLVFGGFSNALLEVAKVGTFGAAKYTDNGWKSVPNGVSRYRSAAYRHMLAPNFLDKDSNLPHLAQAAWNCLAALELMLTTVETNDE